MELACVLQAGEQQGLSWNLHAKVPMNTYLCVLYTKGLYMREVLNISFSKVYKCQEPVAQKIRATDND